LRPPRAPTSTRTNGRRWYSGSNCGWMKTLVSWGVIRCTATRSSWNTAGHASMKLRQRVY